MISRRKPNDLGIYDLSQTWFPSDSTGLHRPLPHVKT